MELTHPSGSKSEVYYLKNLTYYVCILKDYAAQVYLLGGVPTKYTDSSGKEWIAVRPDAKLYGSKPISGGLSHCFPQFGPGAIQQHGFARNVAWTVASMGESSVVLKVRTFISKFGG